MSRLARTAAVSAAGRVLGALFPRRPPLPPAGVSRLLVIKPAAHGDILFASAAIAALRRAYPTAEIALASSKYFLEIAERVPGVDRVIDAGTFGTPGRYGWLDVVRFARRIASDQFDLAVVLDRSPRVALVPWLAGIRHRAGIDSSGRGFALTVRVPWDRPRHEVDLMLDVVRALGHPVDNPRLHYDPTEENRMYAARLLQEWDLAGSEPIVVIHPGGASNAGKVMPSKRWPAPRFAALADALVEQRGARIVVAGYGADAPVARQMRLGMKHSAVDLVGQTTIGQLAALLERASLYAGNDSLPLHLAAAAGTRVLGIYGPTDPRVNGPYLATGEALVDADACSQRRPFEPGPLVECPGCRCIEKVTVARALDSAMSLLEGVTAAAPGAPESTR